MRTHISKLTVTVASSILFLLVTATGSAFGASFTVGGTLSGLKAGDSITLVNNKLNPLKLSVNGAFKFTTAIATGKAYLVTISIQPVGQTCTVTKGTGTVGTANVTNVAVACKLNNYTVGGTLTGLKAGDSITLVNNKLNPLKLSVNGAFKFTTAIASGKPYAVTVSTQPVGQTCTVTKGTGTIVAANIATVAVACKLNNYSVGGTLSGLKAGTSVTLEDNKANPLKLTANAAFKFTALVASGKPYAVTVSTQPVGQTCTVTKGTGTIIAANITTVAVACKANPTYSIGVNISGLTAGQSVTLLDNGVSPLTESTNGSFNFATKLLAGASYKVTVGTQPTAETCNVTGGTGKVGNANVIGIAVLCTANTTFSIGGNVGGLLSGATVTLLDNGGDSLPVTANGGFTFPTKLATAATYAVTVGTQAAGENCVVANGSGTVASANVINVTVTCTPLKYTIGGNLSGLTGGTVTLLDNGGDSLPLTANAGFTFATSISSGSNYAVTVGTQPAGQNCVVTNGSGKVAAANIINVAVACSALPKFSIGGNVSGLTSGTVTLLDNGGDSKAVSSNTSFTFATKIATGATYAVTVGTQPTGQTCTVTGGANGDGTGTVASANVTSIAVACTASSGGGGGGGPWWIPYSASPFNSASDGKTGIMVIESDKITTSPAPQFVTLADATTIGDSFAIGTGSPITLTPAELMYYAVGADSNTHIYGITLNNTASLPVPFQISNLSLDATQMICDVTAAQADFADQKSLFAVIKTGDAGSLCNTTSNFIVVHYKDSAATAPLAVTLDNTSFDTLYEKGKLSGLVNLNNTDSILNLFADETFTSPTHLVTSVQFYEAISATKFNLSDPLNSNSNLFLDLTTTNGTDPTGLYYLGATSTSVAKVHPGSIGETTTDDNNLYFQDVTSATESDIYQVPLTNGTVTLLYKAPTTGTKSNISTDLIGSNNSLLVLDQIVTSTALPPVASTETFSTIPVGTLTTTPTKIGGTYTPSQFSFFSPFLAAPSGSGPSGDKLFVTLQAVQGGMSGETITYSSLVLPLTGSSNPTPTANSIYGQLGLTSALEGGGVYRITGITATDGSYTGGTLNQTDVGTLADTPFKTTGGGNFVFKSPAYTGYRGIFNASASDGTGPGYIFEGNDAPAIGAAVDAPNNFIYPFTIKDTDILPAAF